MSRPSAWHIIQLFIAEGKFPVSSQLFWRLPRRIFEMPRITFTMSCENFKRLICNTAALSVRQMPHPKPETPCSTFASRHRKTGRLLQCTALHRAVQPDVQEKTVVRAMSVLS
jgi:hypothetical protein